MRESTEIMKKRMEIKPLPVYVYKEQQPGWSLLQVKTGFHTHTHTHTNTHTHTHIYIYISHYTPFIFNSRTVVYQSDNQHC